MSKQFEQWYLDFDETDGRATPQDGWNACKKAIIKAIKSKKIESVPTGIEGLAGPYYEDMSAEDFKKELIHAIEKI